MMYLVALVLPPLALLLQGRIFQAVFNLALFVPSVLFAILSFGTMWLICVAWAMVVVHRDRADARMRRIAAETMFTGVR